MPMLNYIPNDGYTEYAYVAAVDRVHGPVKFEFRPLLLSERNQISRQAESADPNKICATALSKKITRWDLKDEAGNSWPITETNLLRLKPKLFDRLFGIVSGMEGGDPDPETGEQMERFDEGAASKN